MLKNIFNRAAERELGFGTSVSTGRGQRLMNPDGSMNVERHSTGIEDNFYFHLVTMSWGRFLCLVLLFFFVLNAFFALLYCLVGVENLSGVEPGGFWHDFMEASFFSTQTLTTVGYGRVAPMGFCTNLIASTESLLGLLSFALISGLLYGRFSRPMARVVFSETMVVAPYQDGQGLMFRMVNASKSEMIETEAQLLIAINRADEQGKITRTYLQLPIERNKISFFTLSWTIVHGINDQSPLWGLTQQDLIDLNAEILVLIKGVDESNEQLVHARRSYVAEEVIWNAKFLPIIDATRNNSVIVTSKVGAYEVLGQ